MPSCRMWRLHFGCMLLHSVSSNTTPQCKHFPFSAGQTAGCGGLRFRHPGPQLRGLSSRRAAAGRRGCHRGTAEGWVAGRGGGGRAGAGAGVAAQADVACIAGCDIERCASAGLTSPSCAGSAALLPCPATPAEAAAAALGDHHHRHSGAAGQASPERHPQQQQQQQLDPSVRLYLEAHTEQLIAMHTTEVGGPEWRVMRPALSRL